MLDDYRRTFPYKLIGPIIDTEQLPTGDQLDQRRSLFPRCLARNNWCSRPPPPLCFPKKWKQKIAVDRKIEGGGVAERDRERDREKKRIEERRKFAPTPSRGREIKREGYEEEGREQKRGRKKKKRDNRYRNIARIDLDRRRKTHARWTNDPLFTTTTTTTYCSLLPIISISTPAEFDARSSPRPNPPPHRLRTE